MASHTDDGNNSGIMDIEENDGDEGVEQLVISKKSLVLESLNQSLDKSLDRSSSRNARMKSSKKRENQKIRLSGEGIA